MSYLIIILIGLALGSFVNALVWRIYIGQKTKDKRQKREKVDAGTTGLTAKDMSIINGRSMCPDCKHTLAWNDLIPVFSWLALKGRCRYCKKPISAQYPLVEVLVAVLAVVSYIYWPYSLNNTLQWAVLATWIISLVPMVALVIYDLKWMEMPTSLIYFLNIIGIIFVSLLSYSAKDWSVVVSSVVGSILIGGLFWLIYQISGGRWIGGGDVRFGFAMGILLGWQKAVLGLALASYLGTILIIVLVVIKKYHKKMRLPFGPFLITATYISMLYGQQVINWYKTLAGL